MRYVQKVMLTSVVLLLVTVLFPQGIPGLGQAYPEAQAAPWNPLEFLVPCGNENWVAGDSPAGQVCYVRGGEAGECTICDLVQLAQNIIRFLIYLGTILAVLMFVYAGVLYLQASASPGNVSKAHGIFMSTLIGLLVILAAWLIIDTLMKTFYGDGGEWGPWNDILCDVETAQERYCVPIRTGMGAIGGGIGGGAGGGGGGGTVDGGNSASANLGTNDPLRGNVPADITLKSTACAATGCKLTDTTAAKLAAAEAVYQGTGGGPGRITEVNSLPTCSGGNDTGCHRSPCHQNGTCVDYNFTGPATSEDIKKYQDSAATQGLRTVWETGNATDAARLKEAGVNVLYLPGSHITAPHFSVYNDG